MGHDVLDMRGRAVGNADDEQQQPGNLMRSCTTQRHWRNARCNERIESQIIVYDLSSGTFDVSRFRQPRNGPLDQRLQEEDRYRCHQESPSSWQA